LIQHLQPFHSECYIHVRYLTSKNGKKISPRALRAIFTGYTNTINHYRLFIPDTKKTIVSADIIFPPLKIQGASHIIHRRINQYLIPLQSQEMCIDYTYTNKGTSSDAFSKQCMRQNPQEANNLADNGLKSTDQIMLAHCKDGKRDKYLGAPYWFMMVTIWLLVKLHQMDQSKMIY